MNPAITGKGSSLSGRGLESEELIPPGRRLGPYEVLRHVGAGGMGVVYQARDTVRGNLVALKTLHRMEPGALLRLKNEFRYIANVAHRNLVSLHELLSVDGQWFFTMEFIEGENLWTVLQRGAQTVSGTNSVDRQKQSTEETVTVAQPGASLASDAEVTASSVHLDPELPARASASMPAVWIPQPLLPIAELRHIFQQLALGIQALHSARKLHCDIKPRNVMVARDGRVVLLDFGLSSDRAEPSVSELAGTPAYMSPEQVLGQPASEASDWYAFGVMLYEALTGRQAFPRMSSLLDKASMEPPVFPPSPHMPEDLRELCMMLLVREPSLRPDGRAVLERLGVTGLAPAREARTRELIGREPHLAMLHEARCSMQQGRTVVVHVHGQSGLGKSSLMHRWFEQLGARGGAVVLSGRCYERESVPYKAFDTLVDSLSRHLRMLPGPDVEALVPPDAAELVRIFPVLRQVPHFAQLEPGRLESARELHEVRRRAFRAFKVLLGRLAQRAPLLLSIDDLQWGDEDSIVALSELLEPPDAPRLLLACSYRTGEGVAVDLLAEHQHRATLVGEALDVREVEVGPLSDAEARVLAAHLLDTGETDSRVERIVREAHGSPFFVEELTRYIQSLGEQRMEPADTTLLERLVRARVRQLPESARHLLEVVAVAGQPVAQGIASKAAALQGDPHAPWTALRSAHLIRTRGAREDDLVECYHDRIRESVSGGVAAETLLGHHLQLATLLEASGKADPERLARHFRGGGRREKAGHYATRAAEHAANTLAFGRAAELYREALECLPGESSLTQKRADALVNAGRGAEAAPLYMELAGSAPPGSALGLRQRAAEQYLVAGVIPEGVSVLKPLLSELGLSYPQTSRGALMGIIGRGLMMQLGGLRFVELPPEQIDLQHRVRMDTAWSASKGLGSSDVMRGGYFAVRTLQMALAGGESRHIARGLLGMGMTTLARGSASEVRRGKQLLARADELCQRLGDPYMLAFSKVVHGSAEMALGEWHSGNVLLTEGSRILEEQCNGVAWECSQAHSCNVTCLMMLGKLHEATVWGDRWLRVAEQNGDRFGMVWLKLNLATALLAFEGPEQAEAQLREAMGWWHSEGFTPQHLVGMLAAARYGLYRDDPAAAWKVFEDSWVKAERDHALGWQFTRVMAMQLRAGTAVALARVRPSERKRLLEVARRDAKRMEKEGRHHARGSAELVKAAVAATEGRQEEAVKALDASMSFFTQAEMALHAAYARRRKGELLGGSEGQSLVAATDEVMRAQGIRDPGRWTACFAPGFTER